MTRLSDIIWFPPFLYSWPLFHGWVQLQWNSIIPVALKSALFRVPGVHWQSCSVPVSTLNKLWLDGEAVGILLPSLPLFLFSPWWIASFLFQDFRVCLRFLKLGRRSKWIKRKADWRNRRRSVVNQSIVNSEESAYTKKMRDFWG